MSEQRERELIAQECARIMLDEGVRDYAAAKRKAAQRLMVDGRASLPSNLEIEAAMLERRRLFADADELAELQELREAALQVMRRLGGFEPRLVGAVLKGTAGVGARATVHVFADTPEELLFALMDRGLRYREAERTQRIAGSRTCRACCCRSAQRKSSWWCFRSTACVRLRPVRWTTGPCGVPTLARSRPWSRRGLRIFSTRGGWRSKDPRGLPRPALRRVQGRSADECRGPD